MQQDKGGAFKNAGGGGSEEKIPDKTEKEGSSATKEDQNGDKSSTALSNTKDTKDVDKQQEAAAGKTSPFFEIDDTMLMSIRSPSSIKGASEEPLAHPSENGKV